jgi:type I restriction enzyme S subunit
MKRWPSKPLGDVLEVSRERIQPLEYPTTSFNYVGLENVEGHTGKLLPYQPTTGAEIKSTKNVFHPGQILFGKLRPYLNKIHLAREKGICSTDIYVLNPCQHQMDAAFASYFLRSAVVLAAVSNAMAGANLPRINEESLLEISAPVPPLAEQERIVKLLDEADELRKLRAQADLRTDALISSLFHDMFGDPAINPMGWPLKSLREVSEKFSDGPFGSNLKSSHYVPTGVRVIRLNNIGVGYLIDNDRAYIAPEHFEILSKHECLPGDVLVGTLGDPNLRACVLPPQFGKALNKADCVQIRPKKGIAVNEFICWLLNLPSTLSMASGMISGQTRSRISMGRLAKLRVPVPFVALQKEFAARVSEIRTIQAEQAVSRHRLDDLFQSILHRAFKGEL